MTFVDDGDGNLVLKVEPVINLFVIEPNRRGWREHMIWIDVGLHPRQARPSQNGYDRDEDNDKLGVLNSPF